jgi:GcrA cell cycle regulator
MIWTDPQVEMLSRLWTEGMTAHEIADLLGDGVTRNAVIGKIHRLGLVGIDKDGTHAATVAAPESSTPGDDAATPVAVATVKTPPLVKTAVTIADLSEGMCRWPADESPAGEFRYCGQPTVGTAPYCAGHSKLAYQPTKPIRRKPDRNALFPGIVIEAPKA